MWQKSQKWFPYSPFLIDLIQMGDVSLRYTDEPDMELLLCFDFTLKKDRHDLMTRSFKKTWKSNITKPRIKRDKMIRSFKNT